jgi:hypothetical protein
LSTVLAHPFGFGSASATEMLCLMLLDLRAELSGRTDLGRGWARARYVEFVVARGPKHSPEPLFQQIPDREELCRVLSDFVTQTRRAIDRVDSSPFLGSRLHQLTGEG